MLKSLVQKALGSDPVSGAAKVWAWKGAAFRADRVAFTKTALTNALVAGGYKVEEVEAPDSTTNIFQHFKSDNESLALRPSVNPEYFRATSAARRSTIGQGPGRHHERAARARAAPLPK